MSDPDLVNIWLIFITIVLILCARGHVHPGTLNSSALVLLSNVDVIKCLKDVDVQVPLHVRAWYSKNHSLQKLKTVPYKLQKPTFFFQNLQNNTVDTTISHYVLESD